MRIKTPSTRFLRKGKSKKISRFISSLFAIRAFRNVVRIGMEVIESWGGEERRDQGFCIRPRVHRAFESILRGRNRPSFQRFPSLRKVFTKNLPCVMIGGRRKLRVRPTFARKLENSILFVPELDAFQSETGRKVY